MSFEWMKVASRIFGVLALLTMAEAALCRPDKKQNTTNYADYVGDYRIARDHLIGIDRYSEGDIKDRLFFTDYSSGIIRLLSPSAADEFNAGPAYTVESPVQFKIKFVRGTQGSVTGVSLEPYGEHAQLFAERVPLKHEDVTFHNGNVKLTGTLAVPLTKGSHPAIILLHGSGPLTRYSFGPYPHFFASLGLAVLIFDKRGTGSSTGDTERANYGDLTGDALAAFRFLQSQEGINPTEIGFWGSSEGGMLTTQVASQSKEVAFIINSSGYMMPAFEESAYHIEAKLRTDGYSQKQISEAMAYDKLRIEVARTGGNYSQLRTMQDRVRREKWFSEYGYSQKLPSLRNLRWAWTNIYSFSPLPALKTVTCPVLGVFGELDVSTPATVAVANMRRELTAGGNKDVTLKIFPNATHSLTEASGGSDEVTRMAPGVFQTISSWVLSRVHVRQVSAMSILK